jgi:hypothetical protein
MVDDAYHVNYRVKIARFVHTDSFLVKLGTVRIHRHLETSNLDEALPRRG